MPEKKKLRSSNIVSLGSRRELQKNSVRKKYLSTEDRLAELEADQLRLIDFCLELQERIDGQAAFIRKILEAVKRLA